MKQAIIKTGGKQYLVEKGDVLEIEKIEGKVGKKIKFDQVLLLFDLKKKEVSFGQPILKSVQVEGKILEQGKKSKTKIVKFKPKVRYRRKTGHRQNYTKVEVTKIKN